MASAKLRQRTLLDANWMFHRGDVSSSNEVISVNYNDTQWQRVQVPHDYVLDGNYQFSSNRDDRNHGYLPREVAWYRKHFVIPSSDRDKILQLKFGGIYRDSEVWLNGHFLGRHPSGYTPFSYDITQIAKCGAENVIVVRVDPRLSEGHWYEGGGIYRHVYFQATSALHVANYGTYVISQVPNGNEGADDQADLTIQTTVKNDGAEPANCTVVSEIIGPDGGSLKTIKTAQSVTANGQQEAEQQTVIEHPQLWSIESPNLYQLDTTILQDGKPVDVTTTTFGIRTIHFDANKGFFLNGKRVEIQGTANHQDFAGVGIAVPDSLQTWRVEQLKKMGCNAWRTAHNPPNVALLDACDRLGMMVMDENRHLDDSYLNHSPRGTTCTNLSDLATMIQRDRNHPSVIMWSLCNEEGMQRTPEGAKLFSAMKKVVYRYDQTRPLTSAMNGGWLNPGFATIEDIMGINYHSSLYNEIHRARPNLPLFGSETANTKTTRGEYVNDPANGWVNSYNIISGNLSNTLGPAIAVEGWPDVASRPFMAGSFTWTGFDYKGEPNPYGWPDISNNTGLMDVCGFPKDKYYYQEAWWSDKPMVHLMPMTWNWPGSSRGITSQQAGNTHPPSIPRDKEGQNIRVVAFSNARQVELFLNGRSLGTKTMPQYGWVEWEVPYQPGELLAKAITNGKVVATGKLETTGAPARIELSPDWTALHADSEDAVVVPVSILDAKGRVVPDAGDRVTFQLTGDGQILGVGNGNPADHDPDKANNRKTFHGHCIAVIEAGAKPGTLQLTATSPGLISASVTFHVQ
jgi:beta-galactosidase